MDLLWLGLEWSLFCVLHSPVWMEGESAYIYHNLGLAVTSAARSFGVPLSQYIDDRHVGELCRAPAVPLYPLTEYSLRPPPTFYAIFS